MFKITRRVFAAAVAATLALEASAAMAQAPAKSAGATAVLVHGAFADGSSWSRVTEILNRKGLEVIAVQLPLTSLADDVAATRRAIARASGPVVLVGHSWGGVVITEAGDTDNVKSLVYVAAFANQPGEAAGPSGAAFAPSPGLAELQVDGEGYARLSRTGVGKFFAPMARPSDQQAMWTVQGPIRVAAFGEKLSHAAWKTKPSWFQITGRDQMIVPEHQEAMAKAIGARISRIDSDHAAMVSHPEAVAATILEAVGGR